MLSIQRLSSSLSGPSVRLALYTIAGALGFLLVFLLIDLPHGPEHWSADLRTAYLSRHLDKQHDRVAIVEIADRTLDNYPYVSPTDRELLADLVRVIDGAEPRAIGLDFIFDRDTEQAKDAKLIRAIREARAPVVLGALDDDLQPEPRRTRQNEFLDRAQRPVGHLYLGHQRDNPLLISEHVIRTIAEPSKTQGNRLSFAEVLARLDGAHYVDDGRQIAWLLPPTNGSETFLTLPAEQVLAHQPDILPIKKLLRGRFVLIGGNFFDRDQHLTPLSVVSEQRFSGLFIHAEILAQLLADDHIYTLQNQLLFAALLILIGAFGFLTGRSHQSSHHQLAIELLSAMTFIVISIVTFRYGRFIFPFVGVLVTWLAGLSGGHYSRYAQRRWILPSAKLEV